MLKFLKKKDPTEELRSLLGNFELPSFNITIMNVLRMLRDPESSIKDIADQLQIDPGLNVKILKTVNSAAFGLVSKVSDIMHAVSLLGRSRVEPIVLSVAVRDSLPEVKASCLDEQQFWATSAKRASIARALAERLHPATRGESFTSALLQDMAVPVIMNARGDKYCTVLEHWFADKDAKLEQIELEAFGFNHAGVGALMATEWGLPEHLVKAVAGHHSTAEDLRAEPAVHLVSHLRYDDESGLDTLKEVCRNQYGIDEDKLDELIDKALDDARDFAL